MAAGSRQKRSDAARNREEILEAALRCLTADSNASMSDIAAEAGVGRVTMYGHFSSRSDLVAAAFVTAMERADEELSHVDLGGDPWEALHTLVDASWRIVAASRSALKAANEELGGDFVREHHAEPFTRIERLIRAGRRAGAFRTDLPQAWLTTCFFTVIHAAADDVSEGRLSERTADRVVWPTIASLFRPVET